MVVVLHLLFVTSVLAALEPAVQNSFVAQCDGFSEAECSQVSLLQTGLQRVQEPRPAAPKDTSRTAALVSKLEKKSQDLDINSTETVDAIIAAGAAEFYDCSTYPLFCAKPFKCDDPTDQCGQLLQSKSNACFPNFHSWCPNQPFYDWASECIVGGDNALTASNQYQRVLSDQFAEPHKYAPNWHDIMGEYCFRDGHCLNTAVTASTTVQEALGMCAARYGHDYMLKEVEHRLTTDTSDLAKNPYEARQACWQGVYQCDVMICKNHYCKDDQLIKKYNHLLKDNGWTNETSSWFVGS